MNEETTGDERKSSPVVNRTIKSVSHLSARTRTPKIAARTEAAILENAKRKNKIFSLLSTNAYL